MLRSKKGQPSSNLLLGTMILCMALSLLEAVVVFSGWYRYVPGIISVTFPLHFLIGPLFYFYISFSTGRRYRWRGWDILHLIPLLVGVIDHIPIYTMPADAKIIHIQTILSQQVYTIGPRTGVMMLFKITQLGTYLYFSYRIIIKWQRKFRDQQSDDGIFRVEWLNKLTVWFSIYTLLHLGVFIFLAIVNSYTPFIDSLIFIGQAFFILAIGYYAWKHPVIYYELKVASNQVKYEKSMLPEEVSHDIAKRLGKLMKQDKPFLKSDLRLNELAKSLSVTTNHLSQVLNHEMDSNFFDYINSYRVEEAKKKLLNPDNQHLTYLAIAYEAGFSSKSSFNRIFRKFTGKSPSDFVAEAGDRKQA